MTPKVENVILVVIDALRTDRVGVYSDDDLTPNIDLLAEEGEVFERCFSCVNATDSSITTILTGQYPTRHGILNHGGDVTDKEQKFVAGTTPLPELINSSHETIGIDTLERWHRRGFDTYLSPRQEVTSPLIQQAGEIISRLPSPLEKYIRKTYKWASLTGTQITQSDAVTKKAIKIIREVDSPFFLFTHYWDTHIPYIPPEDHPNKIKDRTYEESDKCLDDVLKPIEGSSWAERLQGGFSSGLIGNATSVSDLKRKYDAGVWKVDRAIGQLINELKDKGIYEETAIIVTADHGESFTEHGIIFDHHGLYDPTIHIPLIIRAPGFEGREDQFVQHFDLAPTILSLLDKDYNDEIFDGKSLSKEDSRKLDRNAIFAEEGHTARKRAIRTRSYKYIKRLDNQDKCDYCEIRHASDEELYDLRTDPEEQHNIVNQKPEVKARLEEQFDSWLGELSGPVEGEATFGVSQEVEEHLKEMGYM